MSKQLEWAQQYVERFEKLTTSAPPAYNPAILTTAVFGYQYVLRDLANAIIADATNAVGNTPPLTEEQ